MNKLFVNGEITTLRLKMATHFFARLRGWMFHREILDHDALLLEPCHAVHTFGMQFNIDIAFLNINDEVVKIVRDLPPNRTASMRKAKRCIEFRASTTSNINLKIGDRLTTSGDNT